MKKKIKLLKSSYLFLYFSILNYFKKDSLVVKGGPVVSLTSYGTRVQKVHLTIESIAQGAMLPGRLILWLDEDEALLNPTPGLKRLLKRGLEICKTPNYGPHKKYYSYIESQEICREPLVTADDDVFYSHEWLKLLHQAYTKNPDQINCLRARRVVIDAGRIAPYMKWKNCHTTTPSFQHFATGVGGVIYPPDFLNFLKDKGRSFEACCPYADDIWLHANEVRAGFKVAQIFDRRYDFLTIPSSQKIGLHLTNAKQDGNDRQIAATYNDADIRLMSSDGVSP